MPLRAPRLLIGPEYTFWATVMLTRSNCELSESDPSCRRSASCPSLALGVCAQPGYLSAVRSGNARTRSFAGVDRSQTMAAVSSYASPVPTTCPSGAQLMSPNPPVYGPPNQGAVTCGRAEVGTLNEVSPPDRLLTPVNVARTTFNVAYSRQ